MEQRSLGQSGLKVSSVGLGCNNFGMRIDAEQTQQVVDAALDHGITLFDTADIYGGAGTSETFLGQALGARRQDVLIATKFGIQMDGTAMSGGGSRRYIIQAAENSLKRLNTDYIDLYQMHRADPDTPIEETLRALDDLVTSGKVRYIGISNFPAWMMADAQHTARANLFNPVISTQNHYSLISRQIELDVIPAAEKFGMGLLPFFPLESGLLTGKYDPDKPPPEGSRWQAWQGRAPKMADRFWSAEKFETAGALGDIAQRHGAGLLDLAIGWLLSRPIVASVISGATRAEQIEANVAAAEFAPSADICAEIDALTKPAEPSPF